MAIYARRSGKRARQIAADVFVACWTVVWALLGFLVHSLIAATADPIRRGADAFQQMSQDFRSAAEKAASVPAVGDQLRRPFDEAVQRMDAVIASAHHEIDLIERTALVLGWLTFVIPVLIILAFWLPRRIRFAREGRAVRALLENHPDLDLFALRALATQPIRRLARLSPDPMRAWRSADREVITALADLELRDAGVRLPRPSRDPTAQQ
jgi:hypothetical protein